jgi:hypothetical protein
MPPYAGCRRDRARVANTAGPTGGNGTRRWCPTVGWGYEFGSFRRSSGGAGRTGAPSRPQRRHRRARRNGDRPERGARAPVRADRLKVDDKAAGSRCHRGHAAPPGGTCRAGCAMRPQRSGKQRRRHREDLRRLTGAWPDDAPDHADSFRMTNGSDCPTACNQRPYERRQSGSSGGITDRTRSTRARLMSLMKSSM